MATGESGLRAVAAELLPCPFCGSSLLRASGGGMSYWRVECQACGALSGQYDDEATARAKWNRRALLARPVDEPQQCPLCGCNYYYCLPSGQVTGCEHPWHFRPHPIVPSASSPTTVEGEPSAGMRDEIAAIIGDYDRTPVIYPEHDHAALSEAMRRIRTVIEAEPPTNERVERYEEGLRKIAALEPVPYDFPKDWRQQIDACKECARWKSHPIQQGICDLHRRPLWEREAHDKAEVRAIGGRAQILAREYLASHKEKV